MGNHAVRFILMLCCLLCSVEECYDLGAGAGVVRRRSMPYEVVRWIDNEGLNPNDLNLTSDTKWVQDFRGNNLLLFTYEWCVNWALTKNPGLELREFNRE